jgi:hypothetical protein
VIHYPDGGPILDPETAAGKNQPFSTYVNGQHPSIVDTFYGSSGLVKDLIHHGKIFHETRLYAAWPKTQL